MEYKIINLETVDSTNDYASRHYNECLDKILVVRADTQTKGRGRLGRSWLSPKNNGLYCSLVLHPEVELEFIPLIGMVSALAVHRTLSKYLDCKIKWPNDILVNGKKIAGILVESSFTGQFLDYVIVGVGINVNSAVDDLLDTATSIFIELSQKKDISEVFSLFLSNFKDIYRSFENGNFSDIIEQVKLVCCSLNRQVTATIDGKEVKGFAYDLDSTGKLLLRDDDNEEIKISVSEIYHLR